MKINKINKKFDSKQKMIYKSFKISTKSLQKIG